MKNPALLLMLALGCLGPNLGPVLEAAGTIDVMTLVAGGVALGLAIAQFGRPRAQRA